MTSIQYMKKILMSLIFLFLFSSCDDFNKKEPVTSGAAYSSVFSKTCSGGSVHIKAKKINESVTGEVSSINIDDLKAGDKIQISGSINTTECGVSGSISFSCDGTVVIDTNRAFICNNSGASSPISVTPLASSSSSPSLSPSASPLVSSFKVTGGEVYVYQNGTEVFTRIKLDKAPYLSNCPVSFRCE